MADGYFVRVIEDRSCPDAFHVEHDRKRLPRSAAMVAQDAIAYVRVQKRRERASASHSPFQESRQPSGGRA
jgi:hypothetical protein